MPVLAGIVVVGIGFVGIGFVGIAVVDEAMGAAACSNPAGSPAGFGHTTNTASNANVSNSPAMAKRAFRADQYESPGITRRGEADQP